MNIATNRGIIFLKALKDGLELLDSCYGEFTIEGLKHTPSLPCSVLINHLSEKHLI